MPTLTSTALTVSAPRCFGRFIPLAVTPMSYDCYCEGINKVMRQTPTNTAHSCLVSVSTHTSASPARVSRSKCIFILRASPRMRTNCIKESGESGSPGLRADGGTVTASRELPGAGHTAPSTGCSPPALGRSAASHYCSWPPDRSRSASSPATMFGIKSIYVYARLCWYLLDGV